MSMSVAKAVAAMKKQTTGELRKRFAEVFGESTTSAHKGWLIKRIAWRLQANAEGDLTERARQRAVELANDSDLRVGPPKSEATTDDAPISRPPVIRDERLPIPGSKIVRDYKGRRIEVVVLDEGFEFEGERYPTLTAVAKAVTGSHCNGFLFFQLNGGRS